MDPKVLQMIMSYVVDADTVPQRSYYHHPTSPIYNRGTINGTALLLDDGASTAIHLSVTGIGMTGTWDDNLPLGDILEDVYPENSTITFYKS